MPINDPVSFLKMMRGSIPVIIHLLSVGCFAKTCPSSEICIDQRVSKILNIITIAIVIMESFYYSVTRKSGLQACSFPSLSPTY